MLLARAKPIQRGSGAQMIWGPWFAFFRQPIIESNQTTERGGRVEKSSVDDEGGGRMNKITNGTISRENCGVQPMRELPVGPFSLDRTIYCRTILNVCFGEREQRNFFSIFSTLRLHGHGIASTCHLS